MLVSVLSLFKLMVSRIFRSAMRYWRSSE